MINQGNTYRGFAMNWHGASRLDLHDENGVIATIHFDNGRYQVESPDDPQMFLDLYEAMEYALIPVNTGAHQASDVNGLPEVSASLRLDTDRDSGCYAHGDLAETRGGTLIFEINGKAAQLRLEGCVWCGDWRLEKTSRLHEPTR